MADIYKPASDSFPDEGVNPREKADKPWLLAFANAAINTSNRLPEGSIGYRSRRLYEIYASYAQGRQDIEQYKSRLHLDEDPGDDNLITDWSIVPLLPKVRSVALGLLEKPGYKISINTVDPLAISQLDDKINQIKAKVVMREGMKLMQMQQFMQSPPAMKGPNEPDDLDGMDVYRLGVRHAAAMEAEQIWQAVSNENCYEDVRSEALKQLWDRGAAVIKDDTANDGITIRCCDLREVILSYCKYSDFRDIKYVGERVTMPVSSLEAMSDGKITQDDIKTLYENCQNKYGLWPGITQGSYGDFYGQGKVEVLDLELLSNDTWLKEERVDKRGNTIFGNAKWDKRNDGVKVLAKKVQTVYKLKWVIGTDILFDYGKQRNIKRPDANNPGKAQLSYHIVATDFHDMKSVSCVARCIPFADSIQEARYKRQHTLRNVVPRGFEIDLTQIEDISISAGGEKMEPGDVIELFRREGILIKRSVGATNAGSKSSPAIIPFESGVGNELAEYWNDIHSNYALMQQVSGLNDVTDASTPNAKNLNSTNEAAQVGTNNALFAIFKCDKRIAEKVAGSVIIRAQDLKRMGRSQRYDNIIGRDSMQLLGDAPDLTAHSFGITIEDLPSPEEQAAFAAAMQEAVSQGQISIDDQLRAQNIARSNIKLAEVFLSEAVRKCKKDKANEAAQNTQQTAQAQIQAAQSAEQAKQSTLQLEYQLKAKLSEQEHLQRMAESYGEGAVDLEQERIGAEGRVEAAFVQAKERDAGNIRTNAATLIKHDKGADVGKIDIPADLESRVAPITSPEQPNLPQSAFSFLKTPIPQQPAPQPQQSMPQQQMPQEEAMEPAGMNDEMSEQPG